MHYSPSGPWSDVDTAELHQKSFASNKTRPAAQRENGAYLATEEQLHNVDRNNVFSLQAGFPLFAKLNSINYKNIFLKSCCF